MSHPKTWLAWLAETDPKLLLTAVCAVVGLLTALAGHRKVDTEMDETDRRYAQTWAFEAQQQETIDSLRVEIGQVPLLRLEIAELRRMIRTPSTPHTPKRRVEMPPPRRRAEPAAGRGTLLRSLRKLWPW